MALPADNPELPYRKTLPHAVPSWVPVGARFFITINAHVRGANVLCQPDRASAILDAVRHYQQLGLWHVWLFMLMPDHLHIIASFDPGRGVRSVITGWKRFVGRSAKVDWQRNFFEHRLRTEAEFEEKMHYVRMNPVRKFLAATPEAWVYCVDSSSI